MGKIDCLDNPLVIESVSSKLPGKVSGLMHQNDKGSVEGGKVQAQNSDRVHGRGMGDAEI